MKRTRNSKAKARKDEVLPKEAGGGKNERQESLEDTIQPKIIQRKNFRNQELRGTSDIVETKNSMVDPTETSVQTPANVENTQQKPKSKLQLKNLRKRSKEVEEFVPSTLPKNKNRAIVDLKMMTEELKQLEDPPLTPWERQISSARLDYSFYDVPCEQLAQNLLGKVLVRCLENGTILKGRIVETEAYLGGVDRASQTYQHKVTPRNIPMYMPPGTTYVYMTYGMYHCFNISSQESGASVLIKSVEPILGLDYMELLRNMLYDTDTKEKRIMNDVKRIKYYELCNTPSKICTAFAIDEDNLDQKKIYDSNNLWIEHDPRVKSTTIVAANPDSNSIDDKCDGCAVLIRALDPLEGNEHMASERNSRGKSNAPKRALRNFKVHELCNGPAKLCMSFQLQKKHSRYSLCTWKSLWIEDDIEEQEIKIIKSSRIGIEGYGEWSNKLLRYYIYGNQAVSKRDKKAESLLEVN